MGDGGALGSAGNSGTAGSTVDTGSTGTTGGAGSTSFSGVSGSSGFGGSTGFSGSTSSGGISGGSGFAGSAGFAGSFAGSTGFTGSVSGVYSGGTGATGTSGGETYGCPGEPPRGSTCADGGIPAQISWVNTGSQCFTTFGCDTDNPCTQELPPECSECDGGTSCSYFLEGNGVCSLELCPPDPAKTCQPGEACTTGSSCTNTTNGDDCALACLCDFGELSCTMQCGTPSGLCEQGAFCNPAGSACVENEDPCAVCVCSDGSYVCYSECDAGVFFDAGPFDAGVFFDAGAFRDGSLPPEAGFPADATALPDANEILNDF